MIQLQSVSKSFRNNTGSNIVLDNVSLRVNQGTCIGIVGKSGEGKSTILRLMNGLLSPDKGRVVLFGKDLHDASNSELRTLRKRIGVVFQEYNLVSNLSIEENILLPLKIDGTRDHETVASVLEFVGLPGIESQYPSQLSGGQKQRVAVARALITRPEVLLCDEITASLDSTTSFELLEVISKIQARFKTTIVYVTHKLSDLELISDCVYVLEDSQLFGPIQNTHKGKRPLDTSSYVEHVKAVFTHD